MKCNVYSGDYEIISHGCVFLFEKGSDLTIDVDLEDDIGFRIKIIMIFDDDESGRQHISLEPITEEFSTVLTCHNFSKASGSGTRRPFLVALFGKRHLYAQFWCYMLGDGETRKIEYTLFLEKEGVKDE